MGMTREKYEDLYAKLLASVAPSENKRCGLGEPGAGFARQSQRRFVAERYLGTPESRRQRLEERRAEILEMMPVVVLDVAERFGISESSARRDLLIMQKRGDVWVEYRTDVDGTALPAVYHRALAPVIHRRQP